MIDLSDPTTVAILSSMPPDTGMSPREASEAVASLGLMVKASRAKAIMDDAWIDDMTDRTGYRYHLRSTARTRVSDAFRKLFM